MFFATSKGVNVSPPKLKLAASLKKRLSAVDP
jgi:hypothetical protein